MRHFIKHARVLILSLLVIGAAGGAAGCSQLQAGYYLTPENYPGQPAAAVEGSSTSMPPSATPVSTIQAVVTTSPAPLPSPTRTPVPCTDTAGEIITDSFFSRITGEEFGYRVYLPPCYAATARRYPVLIMMHGLGAGMDDSQWDRMGLDEAASQGYAQGALPPVIIVMPNGNDADYGGYYGRSPFPEIVVEELIPTMEERYCTWNEPEMRAIGGLSRGGFWAYWIAFQHPGLFARVGGHSPYFYEPDYPTDQNPNNLVDSAPGIERLAMYFDHGPQDYDEVRIGTAAFVNRLARRGIPTIYVTNLAGGHSEEYWSQHVADYLTFYTNGWPRDVEALPSCHEPSPPETGR